MKKPTDKRRDKAGAALPLVVLSLVVFTLLASGVHQLAQNTAISTARKLNQRKAFWLAEAGLHEIRAVLYQKRENYKALKNMNLSANCTVFSERSFANNGSYETTLKLLTAPNLYQAVSTGTTSEGSQHTITNEILLIPFARFAYASNTEDDLYFRETDRIEGPIHTDGKFKVRDATNFYGEASTAIDRYAAYDIQAVDYFEDRFDFVSPTFKQGLNYGAEELPFFDKIVRNVQYSGIKLTAGAGYFDVTLNGDSMDIIKLKWGNGKLVEQWSETVSLNNFKQDLTSIALSYGNTGIVINDNYDSNNKVLMFGDDVRIRGQIDGRLTIISQFHMTIDGDITYASAPENKDHTTWDHEDLNIDDELGLYAHSSLTLDIDDAEKVGKDVNIHAAMVVSSPDYTTNPLQRGLQSKDWNINLSNATVNLYGSLVQNARGKLSDPDAGTGYHIAYRNDPRFTQNPPPGALYAAPKFQNWRSVTFVE